MQEKNTVQAGERTQNKLVGIFRLKDGNTADIAVNMTGNSEADMATMWSEARKQHGQEIMHREGLYNA